MMRIALPILVFLIVLACAGLAAVWLMPDRFLAMDAPTAAPHSSAASETVQQQPPEAPVAARPAPLPDPESDLLAEQALEALDQRDLDPVRAAINALPEASHQRQMLVWLLAMTGDPRLSQDDVRAAIDQPGDWPRPAALSQAMERQMLDGFGGARRLRDALNGDAPQTIEGAMALAQLARDDVDAARALLTPFWHREVLAPRHELSIPFAFEGILAAADHNTRYFNMMARERIQAAERILDHTDLGDMHAAWSAVIRRQPDADTLIEAVPEALRNSEAGLFMRVEHARKDGRFDDAADLMAALPERLVNPDAWWIERRIVSRSLREAGELQRAYTIAAAHRGGDDETRVEAAFHAGWYALGGGADAGAAIVHFRAMLAAASGDASRAKALYWLARAHDAASEPDVARATHARAAAYTSRFYGQLAQAALGLEFTPPQPPALTEQDVQDQARDPVFRALQFLAERGRDRDVSRLASAIGTTSRSTGVIAAGVGALIRADQHYAALRLAKGAEADGLDIGSLTHPLGGLPMQSGVSPEALALGHAVARQESEFRVGAISPADARGLLQVLPSTARGVTERLGLPFEAARLTRDPVYNTVIGSRYLDEQLARFDNSYVLTLIAYNAGPGRAREWIERFSDPRGLPIEAAVDWIEQIPFPETRSYVQKVMENLQIYKALLSVESDIERDISQGRREGL